MGDLTGVISSGGARSNDDLLAADAISSLYIHVPFCRTKCPYCDFFSIIDGRSKRARYHELLLQHLLDAQTRGRLQGPLETIFFGGGTPSLLSSAAVSAILNRLSESPGIAGHAEISLEANPGTITLEKLREYRAAGINRLSLGVQSLNPAYLERLGRSHSVEEAVEAFKWARQANFSSLSCDLMFGLPGQGHQDLLNELEAILCLGPDHLSCYGLTVEEETPFHSLHQAGGLPLPEEEDYRQMFLAIHDRLFAAGFDHYEISNYARPGHACRHNMVYWRRKAYLGIGAGAHSFVPVGYGERWSVTSVLQEYEARLARREDPDERQESFDRKGAMAEIMYLGLRTAEGVSEQEFFQHFGEAVSTAFPEALARCGGHLKLRAGRWRMDLPGWLLYNHLIEGFL